MHPRGTPLEDFNAGRVDRRGDPKDKDVLQSVILGDFELRVGVEGITLHEPVSVTQENLNSVIDIELPVGTASLVAKLEVQETENEKQVRRYVSIRSEDGRRRYSGKADDSGIAEVRDLPAGKYLIRDLDDNVLTELELGENEHREVTVKLGPSDNAQQGFARVVTHDSGGAIVPCELILDDAAVQQHYNSVETILQGSAGDYIIRTNAAGFEPTEQRVHLHTQQELKKLRRRVPPMVGIELKRKSGPAADR